MFFNQLRQYGEALAVVDERHRVSYQQLDKYCRDLSDQLSQLPAKSVVMVKATNNLGGLIAYLGCLQSGHCALLVNPDLPSALYSHLKTQYHAACEISVGDALSPQVTFFVQDQHHNIDSRVAVLLSTSGSTGSPKQVALSYANLHSNAQSIVNYLPMLSSDKGLCTLPLFYSYGLSVVNSHLMIGACCVFTSFSAVNREYWQLIEQEKISSFAGVPHSYQMLKRLRVTTKPLPSVRYFTQAGGKLEEDIVTEMGQYAADNNKQFYIMYGQTEATARMAYLSPEKVLSKPNSIGQAIPGGTLSLQTASSDIIDQPNVEGELVYQGDNVMLGYCRGVEQMDSFDSPNLLHTGDLGYRDAQGDYYITGRLKRIIKPLGQRIALDDAERALSLQSIHAYCCGNDNKLVIALEHAKQDEPHGWAQEMKMRLAVLFDLHISAIEVVIFERLPLNANGKKDYGQVMHRFAQGHLYD